MIILDLADIKHTIALFWLKQSEIRKNHENNNDAKKQNLI